MLRNGSRISFKASFIQNQPVSVREINGTCNCSSKSSFTANRQGKLMNKLFGERISGSKKRWYPSNTDNVAQHKRGGGLLFRVTQLSKPGGAGKNTTRRSAVLNKLFMEEISSLLATGAIADFFLGRGLQLTRVKIAPDFAYVNVYWLGTGDPQSDGKLADDLQHYSGLLRHELSQLRVMGEVPRIYFVQDKTFANVEHVEALLRNLDLDKENCDTEERKIDFKNFAVTRMKQEFYGNKDDSRQCANEIEEEEESLPQMRHDVFGLDHREITSKILTKMRKTQQAWETHSVRQEAIREPDSITTKEKHESSTLKTFEQQSLEADDSVSESFKRFLSQRRDRRNTPERKKYRKHEDIKLLNTDSDANSDIVIWKKQKEFLNQEDYIHEDPESERKS